MKMIKKKAFVGIKIHIKDVLHRDSFDHRQFSPSDRRLDWIRMGAKAF